MDGAQRGLHPIQHCSWGESGQEKRSRQGILPGGHVLRPVQILHVV